MTEAAKPVAYEAGGPTGVDGLVWAGPEDIDAAISAAAGGDGSNLDRATLDRVWSLQQEFVKARVASADIIDAKAEALSVRIMTGVIALAAGAAWLIEREQTGLGVVAAALAGCWCICLLFLVLVVRPAEIDVPGLNVINLFQQVAGHRLFIDEQQLLTYQWKSVLITASRLGAPKKWWRRKPFIYHRTVDAVVVTFVIASIAAGCLVLAPLR